MFHLRLSSSTCSCPTVAASPCWWASMWSSYRQTWDSHWWTLRLVCGTGTKLHYNSQTNVQLVGVQHDMSDCCSNLILPVVLKRAACGRLHENGAQPHPQHTASPCPNCRPGPFAGQHTQQYDTACGRGAGGPQGLGQILLPRTGGTRQRRGKGG